MSKRKFIACPFIGGEYITDIQVEMSEIVNYADDNGVDEFAILDAFSLEYYCTMELH